MNMPEGDVSQSPRQLYRTWSIAYLSHLALPAFLLIDIMAAPRRGETVLPSRVPGTVLAVVSTLWLIPRITWFIRIEHQPERIERTCTPLLRAHACCLALFFVMEGASRIMGCTPPILDVQQHGLRAAAILSSKIGTGNRSSESFHNHLAWIARTNGAARSECISIVAIEGTTKGRKSAKCDRHGEPGFSSTACGTTAFFGEHVPRRLHIRDKYKNHPKHFVVRRAFRTASARPRHCGRLCGFRGDRVRADPCYHFHFTHILRSCVNLAEQMLAKPKVSYGRGSYVARCENWRRKCSPAWPHGLEVPALCKCGGRGSDFWQGRETHRAFLT